MRNIIRLTLLTLATMLFVGLTQLAPRISTATRSASEQEKAATVGKPGGIVNLTIQA